MDEETQKMIDELWGSLKWLRRKIEIHDDEHFDFKADIEKEIDELGKRIEELENIEELKFQASKRAKKDKKYG